MIGSHGLEHKTVAQIAEVLARFPNVRTALLFGSRAKGLHKPGSDIDLALSGEALDWRVIGRIENDLDDLLLPYGFSIIVHDHKTDPAVAAHIARVGRTFYSRKLDDATMTAK